MVGCDYIWMLMADFLFIVTRKNPGIDFIEG